MSAMASSDTSGAKTSGVSTHSTAAYSATIAPVVRPVAAAATTPSVSSTLTALAASAAAGRPVIKGPKYMAYVESFNKKLKTLTLDMFSRFKTDSMVWRAKERVMTAISIDPLYIIDVIGEYLLTYKEQIYGKKAEFFIDNGFEKEFRESVDPSKVDMVQYLMPKIKGEWKSLDAKTREEYEQIVIDLLDDYIEYVCAKAENK